jgi:hypothetical protein
MFSLSIFWCFIDTRVKAMFGYKLNVCNDTTRVNLKCHCLIVFPLQRTGIYLVNNEEHT